MHNSTTVTVQQMPNAFVLRLRHHAFHPNRLLVCHDTCYVVSRAGITSLATAKPACHNRQSAGTLPDASINLVRF